MAFSDANASDCPLTITREERDVLWANMSAAVAWFGGWFAHASLARDELEDILERRRNLERCFRLLDDIGWRHEDPRQTYELTMDPASLEALLASERKHFVDDAFDIAGSDPDDSPMSDTIEVARALYRLHIFDGIIDRVSNRRLADA